MPTLQDIRFIISAPDEEIRYLDVEYDHENRMVCIRTASVRLIGTYSLIELVRLIDLHCRRRFSGKYIPLAFHVRERPHISENVDIPTVLIQEATEILSKIVVLFPRRFPYLS